MGDCQNQLPLGERRQKILFHHFHDITLCVLVRNILKALFNPHKCFTYQRDRDQSQELSHLACSCGQSLLALVRPEGFIVILEKI